MVSKFSLCLAFLVTYLHINNGKVITIKNCGPDNVIHTVDAVPCDQEPCNLKKGSEAKVKVDFTSSGTGVTDIKAKAYGIVFGAPVPYPVPEPDGCQNSNLTCPLQPGDHLYSTGLTIPTNVPNIKLVVKWELLDQNNQQIWCFEFPIVVSD